MNMDKAITFTDLYILFAVIIITAIGSLIYFKNKYNRK